MHKRLFFWTHEEAESSGIDGVSYSNQYEIEMVLALCAHVQNQGYEAKDVTVIATYSAQVEALRNVCFIFFLIKVSLESHDQIWI